VGAIDASIATRAREANVCAAALQTPTKTSTSRDNSRRCFARAGGPDALQRIDKVTTGDKMKNLTIALLAAVSLLSFAGCKKKGGGSDALAKMTEFKDQMCKCTDKPCADKVMEAMTKWGADMAKEGNKEAAKPTEEDMKKSQAVSEEYSKCMQKAMASAMPPPPPPAGDKPADPAAAAPPAGDKPADPAAPAAPPAGDKPAAGSN
jgi:hypothetical protein